MSCASPEMTVLPTSGSPMDANAVELEAATYNAFIDSLELNAIELVKIDGVRVAPGAATQTRFDLTAGYLQEEAVIRYRYDATVHLMDDADTDLGHVSSSVVLATLTPFAAEQACIEHFGATSGTLMVHPYLREAIASTAQRLGFLDVLLPMIKYQPDERAASVKGTNPVGSQAQADSDEAPSED